MSPVILTSAPFLAFLTDTEVETPKMVYDWTGQRTRRIKMLRTTSIVMLFLLLFTIPVLLLHYNLIHYGY